jgi:YaiO family outer membrane protein
MKTQFLFLSMFLSVAFGPQVYAQDAVPGPSPAPARSEKETGAEPVKEEKASAGAAAPVIPAAAPAETPLPKQISPEGSPQAGGIEPVNEEAEATTQPRKKYEVAFNYTHEILSRNLGTWRAGSLFVTRRFNNRSLVFGEYQVSYRRNISDQQAMIGFYKQFGRRWAVNAEFKASPTHKFLGKWSLLGMGERILPKGWVVSAGLRHTSYDTTYSNLIIGMAEKYWGNYRAAYTLRATQLKGAGFAAGHALQLTRYYGENVNSFGVTVGFGRELETFAQQQVLRTDTFSVTVTARHWLTRSFGVNGDAIFHRQGDIYNRRGANFGVRYRF